MADADAGALLAPEVVAAIDDLELAARRIVEGLRAGGQRSPFHGVGAEFEQHRPYRAGDDLRHLDWKVYARSGRLYTRRFREATDLSVQLLVDTSASMDFPAGDHAKFRCVQQLAAAIAWLVVADGNAVGLATAADGAVQWLPPRGGVRHRRALLARLAALRPAGRWDAGPLLAAAATRLPRRGLVVVLTDAWDDDDRLRRDLRLLAHHGHEVALLQVVAPEERALPFTGVHVVRDLESGERRVVDAGRDGAAYRARLAARLEETRRFARDAGLDHACIGTDEPPSRALRDWLLRRARGTA